MGLHVDAYFSHLDYHNDAFIPLVVLRCHSHNMYCFGKIRTALLLQSGCSFDRLHKLGGLGQGQV